MESLNQLISELENEFTQYKERTDLRIGELEEKLKQKESQISKSQISKSQITELKSKFLELMN